MKTNLPKIHVVTLGCAKNTVDSERLIYQIGANAFPMVSDVRKADVLIINTCGFIESAKQESIDCILEGVDLKNKKIIKKLFVIGCLSARYKDNLQKEIPEVDKYFGTMDLQGTMLSQILYELNAEYKKELLGERSILTASHYAYLKISEGCNNPCSFCAIPLMRGKHQSKNMEDILIEAQSLHSKGVKEINMIAQDLTCYGVDLYNERKLAELLQKLSDIPFERIRLLYAYPTKFPLNILPVIRERKNICNYLDMPIQHASTEVLKSMRRGITKERLRELIMKIREEVPGIRLRTTMIVGYPNETEKEFQELLEFIDEMQFDRLGCFQYSPEESTVAYHLKDVVSTKEKERRIQSVMSLQEKISLKKNKLLIGETMSVLVDRIENGVAVGRTEFDAPEVDNEFYINGADATFPLNTLAVGNIYFAKVTDAKPFDLYGRLVAKK